MGTTGGFKILACAGPGFIPMEPDTPNVFGRCRILQDSTGALVKQIAVVVPNYQFFIGQALFGYGRAVNDTGDLSRPGFLMSLVLAVVGAIVLLGLYRLIKGRTTRV